MPALLKSPTRRRRRCALSIAAVLFVVAGCVLQSSRDSLYSRMGGEAGIAQIVNHLLLNIANDDRIRHHFENLHIRGFRHRLETHFCEVSGGPCQFDGRSMRESHRLLDISQADFNALVEDLIAAMDSLAIGHDVQNEFLSKLAPMQPDVVVDDPSGASG